MDNSNYNVSASSSSSFSSSSSSSAYFSTLSTLYQTDAAPDFLQLLPLHNGSLTLCKVGQALTENLVIIVIEGQNDPIALALRIDWLKKEFPKAIIKKIAEENLLPDTNKLKFVLNSISKKIVDSEFHLYSSNTCASDLAEALKIKCTILDPDRLAQDIRSENILNNPYGSWFDMPFSVRSTLIRRVVLIGPESVGKSTLAKKIKHSFSPQP